MTRRVNLFNNPTHDDVRIFVNNIVNLAISDHALKAPRRSGDELCNEFATEWRKGHVLMASKLYSKVRWTFDQSFR